MRKRKLDIKREARSWAVVLGLALLLRAFVAQAYVIPSGSMIPTLQIGDRVFVEKLTYLLRAPHRGEVVVFRDPRDPDGTPLIKRVAAVGGDTVEVRAQTVYVNDRAVERRAADGPCREWDLDERSGTWSEFDCRAFRERMGARTFTTLTEGGAGVELPATRVPEGKLFMLGDNRDRSADSRFWGFVPVGDVLGRAVIVWWSSGSPAGVRWQHFFDLL
jgi:signal peptidase I